MILHRKKSKDKLKQFNQLVPLIYNDVAKYISSITRNEVLTEDVLQNTLIIAYENFLELKDIDKFKSWVLTIARREAIALIKKYKREVIIEDNIIEVMTGEDFSLPEEHILDEKEEVKPSANDSDELEEILTLKELQDKTEFHAFIPNYLPEGYKEKSVKLFTYPSNRQEIEQIYTNDKNKKIMFTQCTKGDETNGEFNTRAENKFEKINIDGKEVNLITRDNVMYTALWFHNGFKFELIIRNPISRDEVIKIIKELK